MSPLERLRKALTSSFSEDRQAGRAGRSRRDLNEVAAEEYRRAIRIVLRNAGDYRPRLVG